MIFKMSMYLNKNSNVYTTKDNIILIINIALKNGLTKIKNT